MSSLRGYAVALAAVLALLPGVSAAQSAYQIAHGHTSILPSGSGFMSIDLAETRLGLTFLGEFGGSALGWAGYAAAAARKGQWDMFAEFAFNPGFELGGRFSAVLGGQGAAADVISLTAGLASTQRKMALLVQYRDTALVTLSEEQQRDLGATLGFNHGFGPGTALGLAATVVREHGSPGVLRPVGVCVPGVVEGRPVRVEVCSLRYTQPLEDRWRGQGRADLTLRLVTLGSSGLQPHLAAVLGGSIDFRPDVREVVNLGAGAAVGMDRYPGQVLGVLLFELRDAFDANGQAPEFLDRFGVRIVIGVPFGVFLDN